ncbi:hypothetical protein [Marinagarivorans algicola]|uniref:hypothetical protein n=2 Tax=Marinagarivorans algicola TaxID=1513270 RepID=UPI003736386C
MSSVIVVVPSSSAPASSSSVPASSSSAPASSSSSVSPMPTDPVDCSTIDVVAGKAAYEGGACVACHQGFDEASGTAPGAGAVFPGFDVNNFTKFDESVISLNTYLATQMMTGKGMGCAAGDSDCEQKADNIAAYLKESSGMPYCQTASSSSAPVVSSSSSSSVIVVPPASSSSSSSVIIVPPASSSSSSSVIIVPPASSSSVPAPSSSAPASSSSAPASSSSVPAPSSSAPASSSSVPAPSSSAPASSSSVPAPSSSAPASSSSSVSPMPTDPVDCDVVDIDAGKAAYTGGPCVACHGAFDESTGMTSGGAFPAFNVNAFTKLEGSTLDIYIAEKMMGYPAPGGCAGDAACEAKAANIATYLKKYSNTPWCESVASSSSMSSEMSSEMSSSSAGALEATVKYVFPTQGAHLGGATSVKVILEVTETQMPGTVTAVRVNGALDLEKDGNLWKSMSNLTVDSSTNGQEFGVQVQLDNGADWYDANSLIINNVGGENISIAGGTRISAARSIAISAAGDMFFSNASKAIVYQFDAVTGVSTPIYTGTPSTLEVASLAWPVAVDGDMVYVLADSYEYSEDINDAQKNVSLVAIDTANGNTPTVYEDRNKDNASKRIQSTLGIVLDAQATFGGSDGAAGPTPHIFAIDDLNLKAIQQWRISDGRSNAVAFTGLDVELGLIAMAQSPKNGNIYVVSEFEEATKRGAPSISELSVTYDEDDGYSRSSTLITKLPVTWQPKAIVFDATGDNLYIATFGQIFKMNMSDFSDITVVSSSRGNATVVGSGPSLSDDIRSMTFHPKTGMLYVAGNGEGVMMIDVTNGNRYGVVK